MTTPIRCQIIDPMRIGFLGEITTMCSHIGVGCVVQPREQGSGWWVEVDCAYWQDVAKLRETARNRGYLITEHGTRTWFYPSVPEGLL